MAIATNPPVEQPVVRKVNRDSTFMRVSRYVALRLVTLFATVVVGVYLTIMIANMGGYVDQIMKGEIRERVMQSVIASPTIQQMAPDVRQKLIQDRIAAEEERLGLHVPLAVRNFRYLSNALTCASGERST